MQIGKVYKIWINDGEIAVMAKFVCEGDYYDARYTFQTADGRTHKILPIWIG